jgi:hypothetical protein
MIEILGVKLSYEAIGFFVAFIASEVIGSNKKLKNNSVAGLVKTIIDGQRPFRKEDDKINAIKAKVAAIYEEIESLGK